MLVTHGLIRQEITQALDSVVTVVVVAVLLVAVTVAEVVELVLRVQDFLEMLHKQVHVLPILNEQDLTPMDQLVVVVQDVGVVLILGVVLEVLAVAAVSLVEAAEDTLAVVLVTGLTNSEVAAAVHIIMVAIKVIVTPIGVVMDKLLFSFWDND